jgi:hypothetical protein
MYVGETKRPKNIIYYQAKNEQEDSQDFYQLISMLFGIGAFLFKVYLVIN